ncbi:MAG: TIGR03619 family F420-dependent LLM class oxidoreductase [Acidimicrobiia bacterium]|nr:TIGR03619 family F420-dependent LLM class oxidoreductase [Acidimicrobiia bacterium]
MDIGIHLPHLGRQATRDGLMRMARRADELGVHSGWVSDHIAWPRSVASKYPYTEDGSFPASNDMAWLDPIGTMFFVAACTERMKLGGTVLILGYRPPMLTAKAMASLDVLSEGRALLGVGVGWMREEFEVLGMPWDNRGRRADEQLELFEKLFSEENPSYAGRFYDVPEVGFYPKPTQGHIPIWVGGDTEPAFQRTVKYGDCFHAAFQKIDEVRAAWARITELADAAGRSGEITLSIRLYLDPAAAMEPAKSVAGSAEQMRDTVGRWGDIGVSHILLDPVVRGGVDGRIDALEQFMTEVVPQV